MTDSPDDRYWMGDRAERMEARLERPMLFASALVIPALLVEQSHSATAQAVASTLNWVIWLAFAGELVASLVVVRSRRGWLSHNLISVLIVFLTPPFLPALLQGLRVLRLFRLVRLLRVLRLLRLAPLFRAAFSLRGVLYANVVTVLVVFTGAAAFKNAQPSVDYFNAIYWAVTTMTTVGYGDIVPTTPEAKVIAIVLMIVGVAYFAVITGALAERFVAFGRAETIDADAREAAGDDLGSQLERLAIQARELTRELEGLQAMIRSQQAPGSVDR